MAETTKKTTNAGDGKDLPAPARQRVGPIQFYNETIREMKKVTWPTKDDLVKTTIAVIIISLFFGVYLFGVDFIFSRIFKQIAGIFK